MIRLSRPYFSDVEAQALTEVLASGMLIQGARVAAFEAAVRDHLHGLGAPPAPALHCLAVSSGTTALELCLATTPGGVAAGDEVIVPALTWPSPGNAVLLRHADAVLVDVDPATWNLSPAEVARALTPRTRAIIAVDQFGVPAEVPALRALASDLDLIEDAACAIGSTLRGHPCGTLGDVGTFSFHPRKVVTTGEGGMVVTRDAARAERLTALRNHGQRSVGVFVGAGPNARLSELHAALGALQMAKLDEMLSRRRALAATIRESLSLAWQSSPEGSTINHQTLGFVLPAPTSGPFAGDRRAARDALVAALREGGVEAGILSYALHRLPQFAALGVNNVRRFPVADAVVDGGVALPLHPSMSDDDAGVVVEQVRRHAAWALGERAVRL
ncbi:MAG: Bacillosamine/Legionaminic acid biosynthesis aminotransferase PglE [Myxococcaceae bacterium]|nr:Bacillosamine/Legionaminic acid biosynthesis aminotransferase PglE [Myxococcaceae bacterium]